MADDLFTQLRDAEIKARLTPNWLFWVPVIAVVLACFNYITALSWVLGVVATSYHHEIAESIRVRFRLPAWKCCSWIAAVWHRIFSTFLRRVWCMHLSCRPGWDTHDYFPWASLWAVTLSTVVGVYPAFIVQSVLLLAWLATTDARHKVLGFTLMAAGWYACNAGLDYFPGYQYSGAAIAFLSGAAFLVTATVVMVASRRVIRLVTAAFGYDARVREGFRLFRATKTQNQDKVRQRIKHVGLALSVALALAISWTAALGLVLGAIAWTCGDEITEVCLDIWFILSERFRRHRFRGE